jgi:hypothetical protein
MEKMSDEVLCELLQGSECNGSNDKNMKILSSCLQNVSSDDDDNDDDDDDNDDDDSDYSDM